MSTQITIVCCTIILSTLIILLQFKIEIQHLKQRERSRIIPMPEINENEYIWSNEELVHWAKKYGLIRQSKLVTATKGHITIVCDRLDDNTIAILNSMTWWEYKDPMLYENNMIKINIQKN